MRLGDFVEKTEEVRLRFGDFVQKTEEVRLRFGNLMQKTEAGWGADVWELCAKNRESQMEAEVRGFRGKN